MIHLSEQYPPLDGGVAERPRSEQSMRELLDSQNVWFDPGRGLTRRPPLRLAASPPEELVAQPALSAEEREALLSTPAWRATRHVRELAYEWRGARYRMFVRTDALQPLEPPVYGVKEGAGEALRVVPVGTAAAALAQGANAACTVGDLLVLAPRHWDRPFSHPTYTVQRPWATEANQRVLAAWVRGGAYSRPYRLTLVTGNQRRWVEYTTLSESYPGKLDTSDIVSTDPDYAAKVNDRTNQYNAAATAWLAAALDDITPERIASQLAAALNASGFLGPDGLATTSGATVIITDSTVEELLVDDGGDGSLIMAAGNAVPSAGDVVAYHMPGKILRVQPGSEGGAASFYVKAVAKDGSTGQVTHVSWEECAGEVLVPGTYFVYGAIGFDGRLYLAQSVAELNAAALTSFSPPTGNASGDMTTNPPPEFYSREISALAAFQDRLVVICAGGAVHTSVLGDYLNFHRTSALTVLPEDPVSFTIIGGEQDTVRHCIPYDRNLLLVGERQYMLSGRQVLAPGSAAAAVFSDVPGMATVEPVVLGQSVFFARHSGGRISVHAMRPGQIVESPVVVDLTAQAPRRMTGVPVRLLAMTNPDCVLVLTDDPTVAYLVSTTREKPALWPWRLARPTNQGNSWTEPYLPQSLVGAFVYNGSFNLVYTELQQVWSATYRKQRVAEIAMRYSVDNPVSAWGSYATGDVEDWSDFSGYLPVVAVEQQFAAWAKPVIPNQYQDKGFSVPLESTDTGASAPRRLATVHYYKPHFTDTPTAAVETRGAVWDCFPYKNPGAYGPTALGERRDNAFCVKRKTPDPEGAPGDASDFSVPVPVGTLLHQAGVTLHAVGNHPWVVSGLGWAGVYNVRSDRG